MTDIVERLRACDGIKSGDPSCCCQEAADEIERLRAALQDIAEDPYAVDGGAAEIARRALENKP